MKHVFNVIRKLVLGICILYTFNILVSKIGITIPINIFTILFVSFNGIPGIIGLLVIKKFVI